MFSDCKGGFDAKEYVFTLFLLFFRDKIPCSSRDIIVTWAAEIIQALSFEFLATDVEKVSPVFLYNGHLDGLKRDFLQLL